MHVRIAIDLRTLLNPNESGVAVYTRKITQKLLEHKEISWDLFYQSTSRCEHIHKVFPTARHVAHSNTWFHFRSLLVFPKLPQDIFEQTPDLVWMPDRRPFYRCPFPVVMTIHDLVPERAKSSLSMKTKLWYIIFPLRRLLKITDAYIFPSLSISQNLKTKKPKEVTYEGAEISEKPQRPNSLSKKIKEKTFYFALSPADPRKRLDWIVRAAQRFPQSTFVIAGIKSNDKRFKKFDFGNQPNLHLLPQISEGEKTWLYKNARAYLALSSMEGFDLPVLEAVLAKCPVILSNIDVHNELYKNAEWIDTEEDLWREIYMSENGSKLKVPEPRGTYTWEAAAKRSLLFFLRVLGNKNR